MPTDTMPVTLIWGDMLTEIRALPDNSVDACVTDPPYGLSQEPDIGEVLTHWLAGDRYEHGAGGFMGKSWDSFVPGPEYWREVYRVLKPGAHLLAFGGTRTSDLMSIAIRLAGFEIRDTVQWNYGSGFPKSLSISKAIDLDAFTRWLEEHRPRAVRFAKRLWSGKEKDRRAARWLTLVVERYGWPTGKRAVVGQREQRNPYIGSAGLQFANPPDYGQEPEPITAPATPEAQRWDGWGSALKPGHEPVVWARKPLEGTVVENVLRWGTGGISVDGCRVAPVETDDYGRSAGRADGTVANHAWSEHGGFTHRDQQNTSALGRWPANLVLTHHPDCQRVGTHTVKANGPGAGGLWSHQRDGTEPTSPSGGGPAEETVEVWDCAPGCPVAELDRQSGERTSGFMRAGTSRGNRTGWAGPMPEQTRADTYGDSGGASRFFPTFAYEAADFVPFLYCAKASQAERNAGCEHLEGRQQDDSRQDGAPGGDNPRNRGVRKRQNHHPTVKPVALMQWLARLVTPPGGMVLDPFAGSGTTGIACVREEFGFIGYEREPDYHEIGQARIEHELRKPKQMQWAL